ncbi:hypothetical protein A3860_16875 [Niastella vici]|uniref:Uncharacterized protein n=1 Tax=Niastella vici TaxID=1703345 RepID=A0A1V9G438_9BACT|nr:hypothetical protein A3860_16875 [Niastella vici]
MWFYRKVQGKGKQRGPGKTSGSLSVGALPANTAGAPVFGTMTAPAAVFTGSAIARSFAGFVMFFKAVRITGKSGSKGGNSHQGGYGKYSFHN